MNKERMRILSLLAFSLLMFPMMGADGGCGIGTEVEQPGVVPPSEVKCTPRDCADGCCRDGVCYRDHRNETRDTCGSFGAECATCQGLQSCQQKDQGGDWQCLLDSSANWAVQPAAASIPPVDPSDGTAWDADNSAPDVVVELSCPRGGSMVVARTAEVSSYAPTWQSGACVTTMDELLKFPVGIKIIDVDAFFDDPIFSGSYTFKQADFEAGLLDIPIVSDGSGKLRLRIFRVQ